MCRLTRSARRPTGARTGAPLLRSRRSGPSRPRRPPAVGGGAALRATHGRFSVAGRVQSVFIRRFVGRVIGSRTRPRRCAPRNGAALQGRTDSHVRPRVVVLDHERRGEDAGLHRGGGVLLPRVRTRPGPRRTGAAGGTVPNGGGRDGHRVLDGPAGPRPKGRRGGVPPPWTLLIPGSLASLAANVAVAEPTAWSAVIRARPSSALAGAFELLTRERRREQGASSENAAGEPDGAASPTTIEPERPGRTER